MIETWEPEQRFRSVICWVEFVTLNAHAPGNTNSFILVFKHSAFFPHLSVLDSGRNEHLIGAECLLNFFMPLRDQLQNCLGTDGFP